jgi:hypothetical protein
MESGTHEGDQDLRPTLGLRYRDVERGRFPAFVDWFGNTALLSLVHGNP